MISRLRTLIVAQRQLLKARCLAYSFLSLSAGFLDETINQRGLIQMESKTKPSRRKVLKIGMTALARMRQFRSQQR